MHPYAILFGHDPQDQRQKEDPDGFRPSLAHRRKDCLANARFRSSGISVGGFPTQREKGLVSQYIFEVDVCCKRSDSACHVPSVYSLSKFPGIL